MRSFAISVPLLAVFVLIAVQPVLGDAFTIDDWDLTIGVIAEWPDIVGDSFTVVANPFDESHAVSLGGSAASSSYDISWLLDFASFDIQAAQQAETSGSTSSITSVSTGYVLFTPDSDITFSVDAAYTYDLPAWGFTAYFSVLVTDDETHENYFAYGDSISTFDGVPKHDTFTASGEGFIPAGRECRFLYRMMVDTVGSSELFATGSGHVSFTITPEPTTASLLALGGLMLLRRRRAAGATHCWKTRMVQAMPSPMGAAR